MNRLIDAMDMIALNDFDAHGAWIHYLCGRMARQLETLWTGETDAAAEPALARVDFGRWIADCPDPVCGGAEYVEPAERIFFCFNCGNALLGGDARQVKFPEAEVRIQIEKVLIERPVIERRGPNILARALNVGLVAPGFSRSWDPHETVEDLYEQNRMGFLAQDYLEAK